MHLIEFKPEEYLKYSRQFYCIITNTDGEIVCANSLALQNLQIQVAGSIAIHHAPSSIAPFLINDSDVHSITLTHQNHKGILQHITWEVTIITPEPGLTFYKWMAPNMEAESKLQRSELFYRNLIADSTNGMLLLNRSGKIVFVSPSVKNILGYDVEDLMEANAFDYVHPEDHIKAYESFQLEMAQTPVVKFIVVRLLKKNGEWLWCMVRGHNLLENPHVGNIVVCFHDDTLRKQAIDALQESETRFRNLIRNLQVGVFLLNNEGYVLTYNKAAINLLDLSEEELTAQPFTHVITDISHEDGSFFLHEERPTSKAIQTKKSVKDVVLGVWRKKSKEKIWLLANADPILDKEGNVLHVVCSFTDITERKKLEQKLLYEKIHRQKLLTQATIDGQEKERKEIGKELHDNIGQQLASVKLYLELAGHMADAATNDMLRLAIQNVAHVINEVRNISHSLVPPTIGDLGLIDSVIELIESISRTKDMQIQFYDLGFKEDCLTENKKLLLFRILQEQLTNIVKHAHASEVTITLTGSDNEVILEISDNGTGFNINEIRNGAGGLAHIHNRVEVFGGSSHITASPGEGCSLQVSLPFAYHMVSE